jgi:hypothetical protein
MSKTVTLFAAAATLLLLAPGCGESGEEVSGVSNDTVTVLEPEPVAGWLSVDTPGRIVAMTANEDGACMLGESGLLLTWSRDTGAWTPAWIEGAEDAFDIELLEGEPVLVTPGSVITVSQGEGSIYTLAQGAVPLDAAGVEDQLAVLFPDGSLELNPQVESPEFFEPGDAAAVGGLVRSGPDWAWLNDDGTLTLLDTGVGLRRVETVPGGVTVIAAGEEGILAGDGSTVYLRAAPDQWVECSRGDLQESGLVVSEQGVFPGSSGASLAGRIPGDPAGVCASGAGPVWVLTESGLSVWAGIDQVETRLPSYDLARIQCSLAGQAGSQPEPGAPGVSSSSVSVSGVFRIYESVSSRPDPFTEFPVARRDLRRPLEDLAIEELHLVGITLDPSGGDQAMVEDANGVAYILQEGTRLANNTHIAEITSNEVIVVQEVTVGSSAEGGAVTSIPTIYSMRLHEEGGF